MIFNLMPSGFNLSEAILDYNVHELTFASRRTSIAIGNPDDVVFGLFPHGGWVGMIYDCKTGTTVWISEVFRSRGLATLVTEEMLQTYN